MKSKNVNLKTGYVFILLNCFLIMLSSCCKNEKFVTHRISNISLSLPQSFVVKKELAEDSQVFSINARNKRVGYIYYGDYKPFEEDSFFITDDKELYEKYKNRELKAYFSKNTERDSKNGIFNVNYYYYDTINKCRAQIMMPKKANKGLIGIHFDSVDIYKNKMAIIVNDLSEENKELFLKIFKTIKINSAQH
ncbi:hypothetical protein CQ022_18385 [Chryseobacterium culicis]|uniref:Lipoprotein n=1 Tax=Chryseobacterium culicis TaxID=680127 RepID=A0A2S9CMD9_CHRCI|nr:hypothetical protein CQ022_18385 [Chryseobacterium culicis]PRB88305.1 hypothetical protein CQ033_17280 [Chryseobacterium culicis]